MGLDGNAAAEQRRADRPTIARNRAAVTLAKMGWVALALIGTGAAAALAAARLPRRLWAFVGAVLMLGAAGYAIQGRPALGGQPAAARERRIEVEPGLLAFRDAVLRPGPEAAAVFRAADDHVRRGYAQAAVKSMLEGVERRPRDPAMWAGLGAAIAAHDGSPSPAALLAFRRAFALAPREPGPFFLLGLASLEAGDLDATEQAWAQALALAPANAPYRAGLAEQIMLVRQFRAMAERAR